MACPRAADPDLGSVGLQQGCHPKTGGLELLACLQDVLIDLILKCCRVCA